MISVGLGGSFSIVLLSDTGHLQESELPVLGLHLAKLNYWDGKLLMKLFQVSL